LVGVAEGNPETDGITRLRRKIEVDPAHPDAIRIARGIGYMFVPPTGKKSAEQQEHARKSAPHACAVAFSALQAAFELR